MQFEYKKRKIFSAGLILLALVIAVEVPNAACGQVQIASAPKWDRATLTDPLRGTSYEQFKLDGKYLRAPRNAPDTAIPSIIVRCVPNPHAAHGLARGEFREGYIFVGGIVDSTVNSGGSVSVNVKLRLGDGKLQDDAWSHSTDYSSVFFPGVTFNNLLYGHLLPHKEGTNPQVRKVVLGIPEFLGIEVVMQFDMPDANEVGDACGVIWHKHRN